MIRHPRLVACVSTAALAAALLGPTVSGASARTTNTLLHGGVISSTVTPTTSQQMHLSAASDAAITRDVVSFTASSGGQKGLGPLLTALSQVQGIKGTQFGEDLSTLAVDMSNESGTSWQNFIDGANKLQTESSEFPAPISTLFYNLGSGLLKLYHN